MTEIYHSSKGPVRIADMNPHHLAAAHAKLVRERRDERRDPEIEAMAVRLAEIEAEQAVGSEPRAEIV